MAETIGRGAAEVLMPTEINQEWLDSFNEQYADKDFIATVTVEDWLEQPEGEIGSAYYKLEDELGSDGWWQTVSGRVYSVGYTNVLHYHDTAFANVLALTNASLQEPDGTSRLLAGGRLVLVRLDRLKTNPLIIAGQQ